MRNTSLVKIVNALALVAVFAMVMMPLAADAQFALPDADTTKSKVPNEGNFTSIAERIINILLAVAGLVAVIFLIVGGFRYITAGGNEETAEAAKTTITNAIIGVVVIILSFVIVRIISNALISSNT